MKFQNDRKFTRKQTIKSYINRRLMVLRSKNQHNEKISLRTLLQKKYK